MIDFAACPLTGIATPTDVKTVHLDGLGGPGPSRGLRLPRVQDSS